MVHDEFEFGSPAKSSTVKNMSDNFTCVWPRASISVSGMSQIIVTSMHDRRNNARVHWSNCSKTENINYINAN
jgi:hypothetical protein